MREDVTSDGIEMAGGPAPRPDAVAPSFAGKSVLVVGLGRSGLAASEVLRRHECSVTATDTSLKPDLGPEARALEEQGITLALGGHDASLLKGKDLIVLSPGVPRAIPLIQEALKQGIPVLSEVEIAWELARAPIVAVTGTNGKSTVVTLLGKIVAAAGFEVAVAGNIGIALCAVAESVPADGVIVAEISSFQLESIDRFHARVAVLLNITPDHLDRYPDVESYAAAKARVFANQIQSDFAVLNADDPAQKQFAVTLGAQVLTFSFTDRKVERGAFVRGSSLWFRDSSGEYEITGVDDVPLKGPHNIANVMACVCASAAAGVRAEQMKRPIEEFRGLEHRLEEVAEIDGVVFVNDSKATNVDSMKYALLSFEKPVVLIAGGKDKGGDFAKLARLASEKVKAMVLMGQAAEKIGRSWPSVTAHKAGSMEEAVAAALKQAAPGDVVLLAPGCASFDMFKDFEHRGRAFKEAVHALARTGAGSGGSDK
ncbi:MAG: UDP-N-acetylmuramoyl-L-alanine--D-glutamate ligase [Candidatus Eisenbacteria bacterium]|nr:UDP-N-acetylmuramoyl-L-alanine--D-glutamate ligase [Candidatus Eisenbacteria bacterium]